MYVVEPPTTGGEKKQDMRVFYSPPLDITYFGPSRRCEEPAWPVLRKADKISMPE